MKIFLLLLATTLMGVAEPVNYEHKMILKTLNNEWQINSPQFEEILVPDSLQADYQVAGKFFLIKEAKEASVNLIAYIGRLQTCRAGGCSVSSTLEERGESEYLDYVIFYDVHGVVNSIRVFNYRATHGQEVTAKSWLKQYIGFDGSKELVVDKDIDGISGATISVFAINYDIQLKSELVRMLINRNFSASSSPK